MVRTDQRGRALKTFLTAEIVAGDITVEKLRQAVGVKRSRWYGDGGSGRVDAPDFPDPNELLHLAQHYDLGDDGWLNLLVEFGWLKPRPDVPGFTHNKNWQHRGPAV